MMRIYCHANSAMKTSCWSDSKLVELSNISGVQHTEVNYIQVFVCSTGFSLSYETIKQ